MVNPLMSSKQEPFSGISDVLGAHSSSFVKLELDHSDHGDDDDNKIEVKMEVLEDCVALTKVKFATTNENLIHTKHELFNAKTDLAAKEVTIEDLAKDL